MIELEFDGYEELKQAIALAPDIALQAAHPAMEDAVMFLHGQLPEYPAALPESRYTRTATLGRKWTTTVVDEQTSVVGLLGTNVPYAPWVVGPDYPGLIINGKQKFQAKVHVDRWWQFLDVVEKNEDSAWDAFSETFWKEFLEAMRKQANGGSL
jgi:hypothetical protein